MKIESFIKEYRFLSNFHPVKVSLMDPVHEELFFNSVEAAYQAAKCIDSNDKLLFVNLNAADAKALGRKVKMVKNWDDIKLDVMEDLVRQKFKVPTLRQCLLDTCGKELIEGNWWGDHYWGVDIKTGEGLNHLGNIISKIRDEIELETGSVKNGN